MNLIEKARHLRQVIEASAASMDDKTALTAIELFRPWKVGITLAEGERVRYGKNLFKVNQTHTTQADWTPDVTPALFSRVADPSEEWPEWIAPTGAHDAYRVGAKVSHSGAHWISDFDYNSYEPGVYGWTQK